MSLSASPHSFSKGQYSQICDSHLMRRVFAASASSGKMSVLKVLFWSAWSSSSYSGVSKAFSSSQRRRRRAPILWQAPPMPEGREEASSRRMRLASLHPFPEVVTPTWRGPSVNVERRVKLHRCGASATLTGIRRRRQRCEI